ENPEQRISRLPLVAGGQRRGWLIQGSGEVSLPANAMSRNSELCLHERWERQARVSPERVVLLAGASEWTCSALDRRSNQLANYLRSIGVGPEVAVAICLERSPEAIIA